MIKKILYWVIAVVIVVGAVYSYNKVGFGRNVAMLFRTVFGDASRMGGPGGGRPPMGGNMDSGQPGMPLEGGRGQFQSGESGIQGTPQMGQNIQGAQAPGMTSEGGRSQAASGQSGLQGQPQMGGNMQEGQRLNFTPQSDMNRSGGPGGRPGGPGGVISLRYVIPYTFILAFFVLITHVIEKCIKKFSRSKPVIVINTK